MILVAIELENYKQYAGTSRIEFPREGIVAITGANGAGKTTLFEAIEWCLYCPRSISQASIPPHDGIGKTVVRLTLEDEQDGKQYTVVRELRGAGTRAEIYAEDEPWQPLVQGTREVTQYVARKLVGLAHNSFVSTFFAKQRELQMFGDLRPTERRVEVAKLLGLEAVREAQNQIGESRNAARTLADARRAEYDNRIAGRDLHREAEEASAKVEVAERVEQETSAQFSSANEAATHARVELDAQREQQERDVELQRALAAEAALLAKASAHRDASTRELVRLDNRAADRVQLQKLAEKIPVHEGDVAQHERDRARAERAARLREIEQQSQETAKRVAGNLWALLDNHASDAEGILPWDWGHFEATDCSHISDRVGTAISGLDVRSLQVRLESMQQALQQHAAVGEIVQKLTKYRDFREMLLQERQELSSNGDPAQLIDRALRAVQEARAAEQQERLALTRARDDIEATRQLIQTLREHQDAAVCPTCTRPLNRAEVDRLVDAVAPRLRDLESEIARLAASVTAAEGQIALAVAEENDARSTAEKLRTLTERIQDGERIIQETESQRIAAMDSLNEILKRLGGTQVPPSSEVELARATAERAQRIASLAGTIKGLGERAREAQLASQEAKAQLDDLGQVSFDENAMRTAAEKLQASRRAAAQVEQIDVELAQRDAYERERNQSLEEIARATAVQKKLTADRTALGFDPAQLAVAQRTDREARAAVDAHREAHSAALQEAREARRTRDRIAEEVELLQRLMDEADAHERQADELTRMYEEFRELDRYVARQVGPLLAESTERMLGHVTNGKFDQVRFDENYGIEIFDGDEAFPMSTFSGGERDVVALCARLALSEIVGSAALRPPRFLVLDEVFGSLDSDRRGQLLEMLGGLAHSGYFRQMFIISHVDDVQQSPVMTEAWRIEDSAGVSRVIQPGSVAA